MQEDIILTRRGLLKGAAAMIAAASVPAVLQTGCSPAAQEADHVESNSLFKLSVSDSDLITTESCEYIEDATTVFKLVAKASLPYKTLIRAGTDNIAASLVPCATSDPLAKVGVLKLDNAEHKIVLENSVGAKEGFEIFDACATEHGVEWLEQNILKNTWRIYTAPLDGLNLGQATLVDEGDCSWTVPTMATVGKHAFWQLVPQTAAARAAERGRIKRHTYGNQAETVESFYECSPKIACDLAKDSTGLVVCHYDENSSSYVLEHIDAESGDITDTLVLPTPLKPAYIGYGNTGFAFALENIYNGNGAIGNIGTYTSTGQDNKWFRFARSPLCGPAWLGDWFMVKSTSVVAGVNLSEKRYFSIRPENVTQDYGEFLASSGNCNRVLTYSNIDYTPLNGEQIKACQVRVWEPI